jgi:steroid delta-isomerase-like uncharacterized protein
MAEVTAKTAHHTYQGTTDSREGLMRRFVSLYYPMRKKQDRRLTMHCCMKCKKLSGFDRVSPGGHMSEANKALVRRWFEEVWNQGREDTIDELLAANGVGHGLSDNDVDVHGPAEFKPFVRSLRGAIPDMRMTVEDAVAEGDRVSVRLTVEGTHGGAGLGVPATGRRVRIEAIVLVRIVGGQIVEGWNSWDQLGLLRQVGALPAAARRAE